MFRGRSEGIDLDQGHVKSCLEKQLKVNQVDDSVEFLSKKIATYDLILALDVIEHIPHDIQLNFVEAILNALKPGGTFICTVPNANSTLAGRWQFIDWTHYTSFTEHSLDFLLFIGGFEDIQVSGIEFFSKPRFSWVIRPSTLHWWLLRSVRFFRRLEMIGELGWDQGVAVPLSLNLLAVAQKRA